MEKEVITMSSVGGKARADALTKKQRSNIASNAASTRWNNPKMRQAFRARSG